MTGSAGAEDAATTVAAAGSPRPSTARWRGILSAVAIVLAAALVPVSVVGAWARAELVDEERFVGTFAPLARDPEVQRVVVDQAAQAIAASLDLGPGLRRLVEATADQLVRSDGFADLWTGALRAAHRSLRIAGAGGTAGGVVTIDETGVLGIQLGPIVAAVRQTLVDGGISAADRIPPVDRTIVVARSDALPVIAAIHSFALTAGWWLPFATFALFAAGILLARRRTAATLGAAVGLTLGGLVLLAAIGAGGVLAGGDAAGAFYSRVVSDMARTAAAIAVIGIAAAIVAWSLLRSSRPEAARI